MAQFKKHELSSDEPLGKQLKTVRLTAKLSLDQVATDTKISKKYIKALEDGEFAKMPAEVYARGFLENYAQFLGFPVDEVLVQYKRERGLTPRTKDKDHFVVPGEKFDTPKLTITPRTLGYIAGALVLFIVVSYLFTQVSVFAAPPKLEVTSPSGGSTSSSETVTVKGETDPGAALSINGQPIPTDTDGAFKEEVRLLPGTNSLRVVAKNKNGRQRVEQRSVIVATGSPGPSASPAPQTGFLFIVRIGPNSAHVTINVDGKNAFQGLLLPNTSQVFTAKERVLLTTSNAGSTQVLINGKDLGAVGKEGQLRRGIEYKVSDYVATPPSPNPSPK
ncbi:helix-turn-helix domain-containing protein [Patescibacteria group bacterium]|nr:helix-turn-helix domain-containing protein [Patescibacteria group bacterium]